MEKIDHVTVTKYQSQHDILPATRFIKSVTEQKDNNIQLKSSYEILWSHEIPDLDQGLIALGTILYLWKQL